MGNSEWENQKLENKCENRIEAFRSLLGTSSDVAIQETIDLDENRAESRLDGELNQNTKPVPTNINIQIPE